MIFWGFLVFSSFGFVLVTSYFKKKERKNECLSIFKYVRPELLNLITIDIFSQKILCCLGCLVHDRIFNSFSASRPLYSNTITPVVTTRNVSRCSRISSAGSTHPQLETTGLDQAGATGQRPLRAYPPPRMLCAYRLIECSQPLCE